MTGTVIRSNFGRSGLAGRAGSGFMPWHSSPAGIGDADPAHPYRLRPPGAGNSSRTISAYPVRCAPRPSLGACGADSSIATAAPSRWAGALRRQGGGGFNAALPAKPGRASHVIAPAGEALRHKRQPSRSSAGPCPLFRSIETPAVTLPGDTRTAPGFFWGTRRNVAKAPSAPPAVRLVRARPIDRQTGQGAAAGGYASRQRQRCSGQRDARSNA